MAGKVATIALLAAVVVGCATTAPRRATNPPSWASPPTDPAFASSASVGGEAERESGETYTTDPPTVEPREPSWRPQFEIGFAAGFPMGEFADQVDDPGLGLSLLAGVGLPNWPVVLGAEFCFLNYGRDSETEIVRTSIGDVEGTVTTTNDIVMGHLLVRIQPRSGWVRPYVDGLFGFKNFSTDTFVTVPDLDFDPDDPFDTTVIDSKNQLDDTTLSYGVGGGLDIRLKEWRIANGNAVAARLNLGARYLFGSRAKYLKEGSVRRENGEVSFDVLRSKTDMLIVQVGLSVEF